MEAVEAGVLGRKVCGGMDVIARRAKRDVTLDTGGGSLKWWNSNATAGEVQGYRVSRENRVRNEVYVPTCRVEGTSGGSATWIT